MFIVGCSKDETTRGDDAMKQQKNQEQFARGLPTDAEELVWEQTNGPYGGFIRSLLAAPDGTLYVGTEGGGAFRSEL
ncbi:MAG: hypothetical protein ACE5PV_22255 [Candidatus Poribacteria bacterium]